VFGRVRNGHPAATQASRSPGPTADDSGKEDGSGQVVSPFQKGALASSSFPLAFFTDLDMETRDLSVSIHANGVG